jgi:hypothetical protein
MLRGVRRRPLVVSRKAGFEIFGKTGVPLGRILDRLDLVDEEHGMSWMGHSVLNNAYFSRFKTAPRYSRVGLAGGARPSCATLRRAAFAKPSSWRSQPKPWRRLVEVAGV